MRDQQEVSLRGSRMPGYSPGWGHAPQKPNGRSPRCLARAHHHQLEA